MVRLTRGVIVTPNPQKTVEELQKLKTNRELTIINSEKRDFLMEHASLAIEKAYVSSEILNFIVLVAPRFSIVAQNRLLKILEEPPPNKEFILVTKSKASLLPTIKSRLPIAMVKGEEEIFNLELDIDNLTLATLYQFIQQNSRISNLECKKLIERVSLEVLNSDKYRLDEGLLKLFSNSIKALEVNSPTQFILSGLLLKLLKSKI